MRLNYITKALSLIIMYIGFVILIPIIVALCDKDYNSITPFAISSIISLLIAFLLNKSTNNVDNLNDIKKSEGLFLVAFSWIIFAVISSIPYLFFGLNPLNALFEGVSGVTTTGATILTHFDYPKTMFFWRSMTQWLGGMGIIVLFIAVLPQFAVAGRQMFSAEAPGPVEEKITPRIKHTASALWLVYLGLTIIETIVLILAKMPLYDAICTSFSTISAGGFSPNPQNIMGYNSNLIIWIVMIFMFFSGVNFVLQYKFFIKRKFNAFFKNEEFKLYFLSFLLISLLVAISIITIGKTNLIYTIRDAMFQVISLMTSTGFVSFDYVQWPVDAKIFLFLAMIMSACAGSAGGGIKMVRILLVLKYLKHELTKILHPNAVLNIKIDNVIVPKDVKTQIIGFVMFYILMFLLSAMLVALIEEDTIIGLTGSLATIGNIGPAFGKLGALSNFDFIHPMTKIIFICNMIVGRLELIPFLVMLQLDFWNLKKA